MAQTTTVTTGQQSIPEELMPYFTGVDQAYGLLPKAQETFNRSYANAYGNALAAQGLEGAGRIAGLSPQEQLAGQQIAAMQQPGQFAQGQAAYQQGLGSLGSAQNAYSNIGNVNAQGLNQYQMAGPQAYTGSQVSQYMSPYVQQVVDVQKQEALRDFGKGLTTQNLGAARQGTYGGARNVLANTEMQRNLQNQLGNIQATGMQSAFQNAQQQFNTSQQQQQAANQANLQALLGVQQFGAGQSLEAQRANQAANLQRAAGLGQVGQTYGLLGQGLGQQGALQQQTDLARSTALGAFGGTQRSVAQQQLDAQYQDQMRALSFPEQQLGSFANILRGVPLGDTIGTQVQTTPPPSFASQLAGLGLGGLSLFNMMGQK
jgi:hypothetical protein